MGDTFGVVGFGFGFRQRRNGDDEVSFGDVDTCTVVLGTHHKPALHSVVLSGNCPVVSMGCPALPVLRNGCLPWVGAGGGRAVCCYDTVITIYKGGLQPTASTASNALSGFRRHRPRRRHSRARATAVSKDHKNPSFPRRRESKPSGNGNIQRLSESLRFRISVSTGMTKGCGHQGDDGVSE